MNKKKNILIIGVVVMLLSVLGITFAFISVGDKQTLANTFTSGCLKITIENESAAIKLSGTYPVTDVEGLSNDPYTFTIKNTCDKSANYEINLESLDKTNNTLDLSYVKVSLSSDTMDNLITKVSDNENRKNYVAGSYSSNNLYNGVIEGNTTKTFYLREWIDYDVTKEEGANKSYTSRINVIANPEIVVNTKSEIKTTIEGKTLTGVITGSANTIRYCKTTSNSCTPNLDLAINDNKVTYEAEEITDKQMICTKIDDNKTTCTDSFITKRYAKDTILANKTIAKREDFSQTVTTDTTGTIYSAEDDYGTSYYYAGNPSDNWVKFAGFYWRIIRVNGDGTIRMIYNGPTTDQTGETTQIGTSAFNTNYNDNMYVGYQYTSGEVHGRGTDSTIKGVLDNWYDNNLKNYSNYIATGNGATFCNDRTPFSGPGTGTTATDYAAYNRLATNKAPTFKCTNTSDRFATSVGLITADEVAYAGGVYNTSNSGYYLYTGQAFWTMSPYISHSSGYARVFGVGSNGHLGSDWTYDGIGVHQVINLKSDTVLTGTGTTSNPYKISGLMDAKDQILANKNIATRTDFSQTVTTDTTGTVYSAEDDYGTSYYFAGATTENWVKFAGYYWRIIRINGDGTIRMIYQGDSANITGTGTQIGTSAFNSTYTDNMYVGYQYTNGEVHGRGTDSTIKGVLDNWYNNNLKNYDNYIAKEGGATFCNDRQSSTDISSINGAGGIGTTPTYYGSYIRLVTNKAPTLKCFEANDRFSIPVGLITADEIAYAGGIVGTNNTNFYLYTNQYYWTMSPSDFYVSYNRASIFCVRNKDGSFGSDTVEYTAAGIRPVINLKTSTIFSSGNGTSSNPYVVF